MLRTMNRLYCASYHPPIANLPDPQALPTHSRFLRARAFHPDAALEQFRNAEKWRKLHDVDNLYATGFTDEEFEDAKRFYPRWTGRRDRVSICLVNAQPRAPLLAVLISEL